MIRSSLSIYIYLDLPLVALIIKVRSATWHAPRISLLTGRGNQKTSFTGTKIHENQAPRASKSIPKAAWKRYCFRGSFRTSIFSKIFGVLMNFGFQNGPKIEEKMLKTRCAKTIHFWINFLLEFSSLWPPKMEGKFVVFWIFIEKPDFVTIIAFPKENCYFSGFKLSKVTQISL